MMCVRECDREGEYERKEWRRMEGEDGEKVREGGQKGRETGGEREGRRGGEGGRGEG